MKFVCFAQKLLHCAGEKHLTELVFAIAVSRVVNCEPRC